MTSGMAMLFSKVSGDLISLGASLHLGRRRAIEREDT